MDFSTKTLAAGCFGKVYKQKYRDTWAALKKVPIHFITEEQLSRECNVYDKAQHKNVVKLLGRPWKEEAKWHIPLEFVFGEDLETAIFKVQASKIQLTPSVKATIISGMCEGLNFLHSKDIVHQDLKPDNIMIEHESHRAVIIDMGLAKFFKNGLSSAVNLGNEAYAAPEILEGNIRDKRSDVWAMGKITAELCARVRLPTRGVTPVKIKDTLKENPYCSVVSKMVVTSATERSTMLGVIGVIRLIGTSQSTNHGGGRGGEGGGARAGAGRPYAGLGAQLSALGKGASDLGVKQKWHPPTTFPPEAKYRKVPVERVEPNPSPRPQDLVPVNTKVLAKEFSQLSIPCPLPPDGTMTYQCYDDITGQMVFKQVSMKNSKIVKYEDIKITK